MKKEELEDKINSLIRKRDKLIIERDKVEKEIQDLMDKLLSLDKRYVKAQCIVCRGLGYIQADNKKKLCHYCGGKQFIWVRKFEEEKNK